MQTIIRFVVSERVKSRTMNRGTYWSDNEIKTVIAIWGATDLQQQLDGAVRNKVIYEKVAQEMNTKETGYNVG